MKSVSHSTHTKQVPFASGQAKEAERQLQLSARPGTPAATPPRDPAASLVSHAAWHKLSQEQRLLSNAVCSLSVPCQDIDLATMSILFGSALVNLVKWKKRCLYLQHCSSGCLLKHSSMLFSDLGKA